MKNYFIGLLIIGLTGITKVQAQKVPEFGFKGGVNFSTITGDDFNDGNDPRTSFHAGVVGEFPISERFSLQGEAMYSAQGFDIRQNDDGDDIEYQLDYIQVPVLAKLYLVEGLSIEAGPQFGFKVNEEIDTNPTGDGGDFEIDNEDSTVKDFDTSIAAGASYKFPGGFFVYGRYTHGLSNIFEDTLLFDNVEGRNAVWQFGVGLMF